LLALLVSEREKHLRLKAGISEVAKVNLGLVKLPENALMFPNLLGTDLSFTAPRRPREVTKAFAAKAEKLGFPIRLHDLRGTHETLLLDAGVPLKAVASDVATIQSRFSATTPSEHTKPIPVRPQSLATSRKECSEPDLCPTLCPIHSMFFLRSLARTL